MAVSISVVLLLSVLAVIFLRNSGLKVSHALVCLLLGFYLASTSIAPTIHSGLTATADIVGSSPGAVRVAQHRALTKLKKTVIAGGERR